MEREMNHPGRGARRVGLAIVVVGTLLAVMWLTGRGSEPHGAAFLGIAAPIVVLVGASIWAIGYARRATGKDGRFL
jgi:hypothetical protein